MRYYPCSVPGCPELAALGGRCPAHAPEPWAGRTGSDRWKALGCSPRTWTRLARACRVRDGHLCRICQAEGSEVDHLIPLAWHRPPEAFADHLASLMCLCATCHGRKTRREAALSRTHGSPPPPAVVADHVRWWLGQARTVQTIVVQGGADAAL